MGKVGDFGSAGLSSPGRRDDDRLTGVSVRFGMYELRASPVSPALSKHDVVDLWNSSLSPTVYWGETEAIIIGHTPAPMKTLLDNDAWELYKKETIWSIHDSLTNREYPVLQEDLDEMAAVLDQGRKACLLECVRRSARSLVSLVTASEAALLWAEEEARKILED